MNVIIPVVLPSPCGSRRSGHCRRQPPEEFANDWDAFSGRIPTSTALVAEQRLCKARPATRVDAPKDRAFANGSQREESSTSISLPVTTSSTSSTMSDGNVWTWVSVVVRNGVTVHADPPNMCK